MVFVLSTDGQPLDPCHEARARELLSKGRAAVWRNFPFTIKLTNRTRAESQTHDHRLKLDPGSKITGLAIVQEGTARVVWAGELTHRGQQIRDALLHRRQIRRSRKQRHTRYRPARFLNRRRRAGWLEPEHLIPRSRGGSDRITNLTIACRPCNERKDRLTAIEFGFPHLMAQAKRPLKDVA